MRGAGGMTFGGGTSIIRGLRGGGSIGLNSRVRHSRPMAALAQKHPNAKARRDGPEVRSCRSASHSSSHRADKAPGAVRAARRTNRPESVSVVRLMREPPD